MHISNDILYYKNPTELILGTAGLRLWRHTEGIITQQQMVIRTDILWYSSSLKFHILPTLL